MNETSEKPELELLLDTFINNIMANVFGLLKIAEINFPDLNDERKEIKSTVYGLILSRINSAFSYFETGEDDA